MEKYVACKMSPTSFVTMQRIVQQATPLPAIYSLTVNSNYVQSN